MEFEISTNMPLNFNASDEGARYMKRIKRLDEIIKERAYENCGINEDVLCAYGRSVRCNLDEFDFDDVIRKKNITESIRDGHSCFYVSALAICLSKTIHFYCKWSVTYLLHLYCKCIAFSKNITFVLQITLDFCLQKYYIYNINEVEELKMKSIIQTRVDLTLRQNATSILSLMGMSLNDGIRIFLQQVVNERALPFRPSVGDEPNEYLKKCIAEVKERKNLIEFDSAEDFSKWLDSEVKE